MTEPIRILIVEARFYDDLADALLEGATQALTAFGAEYDVVTVQQKVRGEVLQLTKRFPIYS